MQVHCCRREAKRSALDQVPVGGFSRSTPLQKIPKDASLAPWSSKAVPDTWVEPDAVKLSWNTLQSWQGIDHLQLTVDYAPRTVFEETVLFHKPSGSFVCTASWQH